MKLSKIILGLFILTTIGLFIPPTAFCQTEKLGMVQYTPPKDWKKNENGNVVIFSEINQTTGGYCFITLYGATTGTGNPAKDFAGEWKKRVVEQFGGEANPKTEKDATDDWTGISGGSAIEFQGNKSVAFLTVFSRGDITFSVLGITNDEKYLAQLVTFVSSIKEDKTAAPADNTTTTQTATYDSNGKLIIPLPTRQLTVADFAGEWGEDASRVTTTYVYRSSGNYAGSDNLTFRSKMTITKDGGYLNDFYAIQNMKKIIEKTHGTISVNGRVFSITQADTQKFVIRGWLELSDMTIMILCGPLYDKDIARHIENAEQGANLNNIWVRKK